VANLRAQKGYEVLLAAARQVLDTGAPVRFVAVGYGEDSAAVHAAHRAQGLGDRFQLLGARSDVLRLLAGSDIFVLASHFEGLPVAIMEATSMGLPIVSTAVGEIPSVLTDGVDALLVTPGRPDDLAAAIIRLAGDPSLRERLGAAALERSSLFDIARAAAQIEAIYGELLDDAG
jgi:glycosyltransferase involved in cell wall biosynthesis